MRQYVSVECRRRARIARVANGTTEIPEVTLGAYMRALRGDPCGLCGGVAGHIDHIVPGSTGGENSWDNYSAICRSCNSTKTNLPLLETLRRCLVAVDLVPLLREYWGDQDASCTLRVPRGLAR